MKNLKFHIVKLDIMATHWTVQDTELNVVLVFSLAVRQEYVGRVGIDRLSLLVSALL